MIGLRASDSSGKRAALVLVVVCLLFAAPASAHAYLHEASPNEGERIDHLPEEVVLEFTGDGIELAEVTVTGPDGEDSSGTAAVDSEDRRVVATPLETDGAEEGVYVVEWEVLADDGHTTSGTYLFVLGEGDLDREQLLAVQNGGADEETSWLESTAKGLVLLSVVGLVGVPVALWIAVYPVFGSIGAGRPSSDGDRRAIRLLAGAGVVLLAGVVVLGVEQATSVGGSLSRAGFESYLGTTLGRVWLGQVVAAAGVVAALAVAMRRPVSRRYWLGAAVGGGLAVQFAISWTSHSANAVARLEGTVIDFAHLGGAALWLGGLAALAVVVPPLLRRAPAERRAALAGVAVQRFSVVALTAVTVGVTTGLLLAAWHVPDLEALGATLYGTALSAKTALVVLALGLGGFTRFVLLKRLRAATERSASADSEDGSRRVSGDGGRSREGAVDGDPTIRAFVRTIRLEVVLLVLVVALSGAMTSVPTAAMVDDDDDPAAFERTDGELELTVTVVPSTEALDRAYVDEGEPIVLDVRFERDGDGLAVDDGEADLFLRSESYGTDFQVALEETDDGPYSTVQTLPEPEHWDVRVTAWVDGQHVSEWIEVYAVPAGHDHGDHDHQGVPDGPLSVWLQLLAVGTGLLGTVAVVLETVRFDRRMDGE